MAILISNNIDFKATLIKRNGGYYILIIGKIISEDDISILDIYSANTKTLTFAKETTTAEIT